MIGNDRVEVRKTHKLFVGGAFSLEQDSLEKTSQKPDLSI